MNKKTRLSLAVVCGVLMTSGAFAAAPARYELTITNGSQMPISPGAIYVKTGDAAVSVGETPTAGFIQLCQMGNPATRSAELKALMGVTATQMTSGPILPGESKTVTINVSNPAAQSIHFESMYGKTKDTCAVATVNSHSLVALQQHVTTQVVNRDAALQSGAFQNPVLPAMGYPGEEICTSATDAITCLRQLAAATTGTAKVRFFSGYSPSLVSALEARFGSEDVQTLLFSDSGAVQLKLKLKH